VLRDYSRPSSAIPERETGGGYTRKEVLRLLKIEGRQLRSWERQHLVPELQSYRFSDLLVLKRIARLRSEKAHPRLIKQAQHAVTEWLRTCPQLDGDVQVYKDGRRVRIQIGKQKLDPASGQFLFDFADQEINKLLQLPPSGKSATEIAQKVRQKMEADYWFERGLELEQKGAPGEKIIEAYLKAVQLDPYSAAALVNLGTVYFNSHSWADAEEQYKKALEIDPDYALAHFNLGNLYDERNDVENALHHYYEALRVHPHYADAHYNLALVYQNSKDLLNAVRHWRAYLKLDSGSNWAQIARRELEKLEAMTLIEGSRPPSSRLHLVLKNEKA
jgi:tetratricopeptide (TPR) repeat protein